MHVTVLHTYELTSLSNLFRYVSTFFFVLHTYELTSLSNEEMQVQGIGGFYIPTNLQVSQTDSSFRIHPVWFYIPTNLQVSQTNQL